MKTQLLVFPILFLFLSCEVQGELTRDPVENSIDTPNSVLKYEGIFMPTSGISATGEAKIYLDNGQYKLELQNFSVSNGPDLKVYLSKANMPNGFVNLGNLSSATVYAIPKNVDVSVYRYVLIHCQQYNHLFAFAPLTEN